MSGFIVGYSSGRNGWCVFRAAYSDSTIGNYVYGPDVSKSHAEHVCSQYNNNEIAVAGMLPSPEKFDKEYSGGEIEKSPVLMTAENADIPMVPGAVVKGVGIAADRIEVDFPPKEPGYDYVASPYSHPNPDMMVARHRLIESAVAVMLQDGMFVYSPIVHCHEIAMNHEMKTGFNYWENYNRAMLRKADRMIVMTIDGWKESKGVQAEVKYAQELGLDIEYW